MLTAGDDAGTKQTCDICSTESGTHTTTDSHRGLECRLFRFAGRGHGVFVLESLKNIKSGASIA